MSCRICGKQWCTECFHSIEEQEQFEKEQEAHLDMDEIEQALAEEKECPK